MTNRPGITKNKKEKRVVRERNGQGAERSEGPTAKPPPAGGGRKPQRDFWGGVLQVGFTQPSRERGGGCGGRIKRLGGRGQLEMLGELQEGGGSIEDCERGRGQRHGSTNEEKKSFRLTQTRRELEKREVLLWGRRALLQKESVS